MTSWHARGSLRTIQRVTRPSATPRDVLALSFPRLSSSIQTAYLEQAPNWRASHVPFGEIVSEKKFSPAELERRRQLMRRLNAEGRTGPSFGRLLGGRPRRGETKEQA